MILDPYTLREEVQKLYESGAEGADAKAKALIKQHGYDEDSWRKQVERIKGVEDKGWIGKTIDHHAIQSEHGARARRANSDGSWTDEIGARLKGYDDYARVFADSVSFGLADPIAANLQWNRSDATTAKEREKTQEARNRMTPTERTLFTLGGAVASPTVAAQKGASLLPGAISQGAGWLNKTGRAALEGVLYGSTDAAGHQVGTNLTAAQRAADIGIAAAGGGVGGPAFLGLGALANKAIGAGREGLTQAQRIIMEAIERDARARARVQGTPAPTGTQAVAGTIRDLPVDPTNPGQVNPNVMFGDTGPSARGTTAAITTQPGEGSAATRLVLEQRARGEESRMKDLARDTLPSPNSGLFPGPTGDRTATENAQKLLKGEQKKVNQQYDPALANTAINIPPTAIEPIIQQIDNELSKLSVVSLQRRPLERLRESLVAQKAVPAHPGDPANGIPPTAAQPEVYQTDPQILQNIKLEHGGQVVPIPGEGRGVTNKMTGMNQQVAGGLNDVLATHVPGYADLNRQHGNLSQLTKDIDTGTSLLSTSTTPEQVQTAMNRAPGPVMTGAVESLDKTLQASGPTFSGLNKLASDRSPDTEAKMRMIMGDDAYNRLIQGMGLERDMKSTQHLAAGNPPTAERLAAVEAFGGGAADLIPTVSAPMNIVLRLISDGANAFEIHRSKRLREAVGDMTSLRGQELSDYLAQLISSAQAQIAKGDAYKGTAGVGGNIGGLLGVPDGPQTPGLVIDIDRPNRLP